MDHPRAELKYIDAKDLDGSGSSFADVEVTDPHGEKLGKVEGFIMDVVNGTPRHVVVSAGWFIHKHFLLPIGHATLSAEGRTLIADVPKERVKRFPGFDKGEFEQLDPSGLAQLDATIAAACLSDGSNASADHYRVPGWWKASVTTRDLTPDARR